jgi:hypothetical protein
VSQDQFVNTEFRATNEDFKDLLGYKGQEEAASKRWPVLAPVLYADSQIGNAHKVFRSEYVRKVCWFI